MSDGGTETYVIGTDEAGYGPNLGPLTIAATVWRVDAPLKPRTKEDPFRRFARKATDEPDHRPLIDDSKAIYSRGGLRDLERATLAMLQRAEVSALVPVGLAPPPAEPCMAADLGGLTSPARQEDSTSAIATVDCPALSLRRFWRTVVCQGDVDAWEELFWLREFADALPIAPAEEEDALSDAPKKKRRRATPSGPTVTFQFARAAAVFPESFNRGVAEAGNKASLLTRTTLALAARIVEELPPGATVFWSADRHGGRKWYRDALQEAFPDSLVMTVDESSTVSRYRWIRDGATVECEFRVEGDSYVPTALASMSAKYLRELCMAAWNAHWRERLPELRPTAGYPGDARRFFEQIRDLLLADGVSDHAVWRRC